MIRKANELKTVINEAMKGGPGQVKQIPFASSEELFNHIRVFSKMTLEPNCGIGEHGHQNEAEVYYIIKGEAVYTDDDKEYIVKEGDVTICESGHKHSITNKSSDTCEYIAVIVVE